MSSHGGYGDVGQYFLGGTIVAPSAALPVPGGLKAVAVECRGFGAYPTRTFVKDFHWSRIGFALLGIYILFVACLLYAERTGFWG